MGFLTQAFEKRSVTVVGNDLWRSWKASGDLAGVSVTPDTAMTFSAVFAAHKILAESTAILPLFLLRRLEPRGKESASDHPLYSVLHDVANPEMDAYLVRETLTAHMVGWGRAYAKIDYDARGQIRALWPIPPARVTNRRDNNLQLVFDVIMPDGQKKTYPSYEMLFLRALSTDGINTYSPIAQAKQGIGLALAAEGYGASFFGNGAAPQGVLKHPKALSDKARDNIMDSWNSEHQGFTKANKVALLEEGMDYAAIGLPPEDAQFLQTRQFQVEEIARWYRIPNMMLNMSGANSTYASVEAYGLQFIIYTLYPWLVRWEKAISMQLLLERERKTLYAEHLMTAILRGDTNSRFAAYGTGRQWGWYSVNDIRALENMNPIQGGDTYLTPANMIDSQAEPAKIQRSYLPVLTDAVQRVLKRESNDIRAAVQRTLAKRGAEAFGDWLSEFYQEHQDFMVRNLTPAVMSYAEMLAEGQDLSAVSVKVGESLRLFALRRAGQMQAQIKNVLSEADPARSIEEILSGWDAQYVERIARMEISRQTAVLLMPIQELTMLPKDKQPQQDIERRAFAVNELRAAEKDGKPVIEGYAAVFNAYSEDLGGFVEIIEPGFFDDVLDGDTRALWNHSAEMVLGRTKAGTLEISQDEKGLFQRTYPPVTPPDATSWAMDALVSIRRGDVNQQSFAFRVKSTWRGDPDDGDEWYVLGDVVVRRLKKGGCRELLDVSPVTYPAYPQTNVGANTRSRYETFKESLQRQEPQEGQGPEWQEPLDSLKRRLELKSQD